MNGKAARALGFAAATAIAGGVFAAPAEDAAVLDWSRLTFRFSNFVVKARTDFSRQHLAAADFIRAPLDVPGRLQPSGETVIRIDVDSSVDPLLIGRRRSETRLWFDPANFAALESSKTRSSHKPKHRVSVYVPGGVHRLTARPADRGERDGPPQSWTQLSESQLEHAVNSADCALVSEPAVLLYILSSTATPAESLHAGVCVLSKRRLHRLRLSSPVLESLQMRYRVHRGDGTSRDASAAQALRYSVHSLPADASGEEDDDAATLFGLEGEVRVFVDPASRLPLQLSGSVPIFGEVEYRLSDVWLLR